MYGIELIMDLKYCDISTFTRESIGKYFDELCELIDMQQGDRHFWDDEGLPPEECQTDPKTCGVSAVQFILTSTVVIHTLTKLRKAYVNIFSCKKFDVMEAQLFTEKWFIAQALDVNTVERL